MIYYDLENTKLGCNLLQTNKCWDIIKDYIPMGGVRIELLVFTILHLETAIDYIIADVYIFIRNLGGFDIESKHSGIDRYKFLRNYIN